MEACAAKLVRCLALFLRMGSQVLAVLSPVSLRQALPCLLVCFSKNTNRAAMDVEVPQCGGAGALAWEAGRRMPCPDIVAISFTCSFCKYQERWRTV